jgi:hypothetical protein
VTATPTESSENVFDVEFAASMIRTRKFAELSCAGVQAWPHVSDVEPSEYVARLVVRFEVVLAAVQLVPPSQDSCTQNLGALFDWFTRPRN